MTNKVWRALVTIYLQWLHLHEKKGTERALGGVREGEFASFIFSSADFFLCYANKAHDFFHFR